MKPTLRSKTHTLLHGIERNSRLSLLVHLVLASAIVINVVSVIFDSVHELAEKYYLLFATIEIVCTLIFTIEYGLRIWSSPDDSRFSGRPWARLRYMLTPMAGRRSCRSSCGSLHRLICVLCGLSACCVC